MILNPKPQSENLRPPNSRFRPVHGTWVLVRISFRVPLYKASLEGSFRDCNTPERLKDTDSTTRATW